MSRIAKKKLLRAVRPAKAEPRNHSEWKSPRRSSAEEREWYPGILARSRRLADLFDYAPVSYLIFDDNALIHELNLTAARFLKTSRPVLLNYPFSSIVDRQDVELFFDHLRRCRESHSEPIVSEMRIRNGSTHSVFARVVSVPFIHDQKTFYHSVILDQSDIKATEIALQEAKKHSDQIVRTVRHPLVVLDEHLRIVSANPAFSREFKTDFRRIQGLAIHRQEVAVWKTEGMVEKLADVASKGTGIDHMRVECETMGASDSVFLLDASRFYRQTTRLVLVALENITPRVRIERELLQTQELLETRVERRTTELAEANSRLLNLSRRLAQAQENERRRISYELHDQIGQIITGLKLMIENAIDQSPPALQPRLKESRDLAYQLQTRVQKLSLDLRPPLLDEAGLLPALEAQFQAVYRQMGLRIDFQHTSSGQLAPETEQIAFRVIQESLTNIVKHSGVSRATVRLWQDANFLGLQIEDDGAGFDSLRILEKQETFGIFGMQERVRAVNGNFSLETEPGKGTKITVELPLAASTPGS